MAKTFKWKPIRLPSPDRPNVGRSTGNIDEVLTGYIGRWKASDLEERSARSLDRYKVGFQFRTQFVPSDPPIMLELGDGGRDVQGNVEADFLLEAMGLPVAVLPDGQFAHRTRAQRERDREQDAKLAEVMRVYGGGYVIRVPHYWLTTQEQSDTTWEEILRGRARFD